MSESQHFKIFPHNVIAADPPQAVEMPIIGEVEDEAQIDVSKHRPHSIIIDED